MTTLESIKASLESEVVDAFEMAVRDYQSDVDWDRVKTCYQRCKVLADKAFKLGRDCGRREREG